MHGQEPQHGFDEEVVGRDRPRGMVALNFFVNERLDFPSERRELGCDLVDAPV